MKSFIKTWLDTDHNGTLNIANLLLQFFLKLEEKKTHKKEQHVNEKKDNRTTLGQNKG